MSDITATNCGCERDCGCNGGCNGFNLFNTNGSCDILWLIILLSLFNNCGCSNGCNGFGNGCSGDNGCFIILILLILGGCGCGNNSCC